MGKLNATKVKNAKPRMGADGKLKGVRLVDGDGLHLIVKPTGARSWSLRAMRDGRSWEIGLGSVDTSTRGFRDGEPPASADVDILQNTQLNLAEARQKASILRGHIRAGRDPLVERDRNRNKKVIPSFREAAIATHSMKKDGLGAKSQKEFLASLETHVFPTLGKISVEHVNVAEVARILGPIWAGKPGLGKKLRVRIDQVLAYSKVQGWRSAGAIDFREIKPALPRQRRAKNHPAVPFVEVPKFFESQWELDLTAGRAALLLLILTGVRSGEARKARWDQVDFNVGRWHREAEIMKANVDHSVVLSSAAINLLKKVRETAKGGKLIFPNVQGEPLSDAALLKVLRVGGRAETVHGFRSSFRDWTAERMPHIPFLVAEAALAHGGGNATEKAYIRTKFFDQQMELMEGWGRFVAPQLSLEGALGEES